MSDKDYIKQLEKANEILSNRLEFVEKMREINNAERSIHIDISSETLGKSFAYPEMTHAQVLKDKELISKFAIRKQEYQLQKYRKKARDCVFNSIYLAGYLTKNDDLRRYTSSSNNTYINTLFIALGESNAPSINPYEKWEYGVNKYKSRFVHMTIYVQWKSGFRLISVGSQVPLITSKFYEINCCGPTVAQQDIYNHCVRYDRKYLDCV
jgi:hypothetical protein